jgi:deoxyribodipyrimidine photolyase-related protein
METTLVFPHQLYKQHRAIGKGRLVWLIEDELYFTQYRFHRQKIVLHRASMKYYEQELKRAGHDVSYIGFSEARLETVFQSLNNKGICTIHYTDTADYLLERRLARLSKKFNIELRKYSSPGFLTTEVELTDLFRGEKKYFMASFYQKQRRRLNILMDGAQPLGGKWSFDAENRKRIPAGLNIPAHYAPSLNNFVKEAVRYAEKNFPGGYGDTDTFGWPTTHEEAENVLLDFLQHRMHHFGEYEDAIVKNQSVLFHSVLTPALNIGLLTPKQIIDKTFELHHKLNYPLNSLEGFVRQIIGWREFMRAVYIREGVNERTRNFWQFKRKIPPSFYDGTTGIEPIDNTIKKILKTGYCHHIERLMVLGNFMHLCGFDPDEVYRWFMELFIDAYDGVMVPNVYGMSQYADGGLITTKPYVSGSNYILKMSDYSKGPWCEIWDALYWNYIDSHKSLFSKNPRMSMIVNLVNKMDTAKMNNHRKVAGEFLDSL